MPVPVIHDPRMNYRPCMVLAHADSAYAADACRRFRRLGWDVYQAEAGAEVRRLARMLQPELIVLDVNLAGESGWLTCAKLTQGPGRSPRIVLITDQGDPKAGDMAHFVGANAIVPREQGLNALMQASWTRPESAAG
jgi:DNA-binding response OmpR family regulator